MPGLFDPGRIRYFSHPMAAVPIDLGPRRSVAAFSAPADKESAASR